VVVATLRIANQIGPAAQGTPEPEFKITGG
jgi:hypothetical protein